MHVYATSTGGLGYYERPTQQPFKLLCDNFEPRELPLARALVDIVCERLDLCADKYVRVHFNPP